MLDSHPYSAQQIFQRLRARKDHRGGVTILRDYVRLHPAQQRPWSISSCTSFPGECAQVDRIAYGTVAVGNTRRGCRSSSWCWRSAAKCSWSSPFSQPWSISSLVPRTRLRRLPGVPSKIMVDNLKSAVLQRLIGQAPVFNPRYHDFARHHGCDRGLQCRPRQREGARGVRCGLRQKEFPAWARVDRLPARSTRPHGSGSIPLPTYASTVKRTSAPSICLRKSSVRIWDRPTRTPTTLHTLRPVSRPASSASPWIPTSIPSPPRVRSPPIDGQSLSRPGLHLLRQPAHRPSHALLWSARGHRGSRTTPRV